MNNTRYLELDFYRTGYKAVKAHQYDKDTRFIEITCVNDASPFPLDPVRMTCDLKLKTPDGRHMFKSEAIQPDGKVLVALEESMLLASGICKAELNVYELDSRKLLSTMPFDLIVVGSVYDNTVIENSDEFSVLNDMIFCNKELGDSLEQLETNITKAEAGRNAAEIKRVEADNTRFANEDTRMLNEMDRQRAEQRRCEDFNVLQTAINTELDKLENINVEALSEKNSYQIKITDKSGNSNASPNLLNTLEIGTVETGDSGEKPTATITGEFGHQKINLRLPSGKPFKISKTYTSIDAMNADVNNIDLYAFIMINTGSVEDEDTGKLYMKDTMGMTFITDLSGVQGIQGVKGEIGITPQLTIGTVTTGEPDTEVNVAITGTAEKPVINFVIPRGKDGTSIRVKGNAESEYREGDVNITPENIGLGKVGNYKAVSTESSQGLSAAEKANARANIGAGTSSFSGSYTDLANKPAIPNVGNGTITIKQGGASKGTFTLNQSGDATIELTDNNTWRGIQNNLTSTSATDSLSANQGRLLANGNARDNTKLPLAGGGTLTGGDLKINGSNSLYGLRIMRHGADNESARFYVGDSGLVVDNIQDEASSSIIVNLIANDTENGHGGANAGEHSVKMLGTKNGSYVYATGFYENNISLADKYLGKSAKAAAAEYSDKISVERLEQSDANGLGPGFSVETKEMSLTSKHIPPYGNDPNPWFHIYTCRGADARYATQLALGMTLNAVWYRRCDADVWGDWIRLDIGYNNIPETILTWTTSGVNVASGSKNLSYYMVKNGWCFFQIIFALDQANLQYNINAYLPKPMSKKHIYYWSEGCELRVEGSSGQIRLSAPNTDFHAICGSYPVL